MTGGSPGQPVRAAATSSLTARLVPVVPPAIEASLPAFEETSPIRPPLPKRAERRSTAAPALAEIPAAETTLPGSGAVAPAPDPTYYAARELDVFPALATPLQLRYSERAAAAAIEGRALLLVLIDDTGNVDDVSVVETLPDGYFEDDAKQALMSARFTPALKNGRPVKSRLLVQITYGAERAAQY